MSVKRAVEAKELFAKLAQICREDKIPIVCAMEPHGEYSLSCNITGSADSAIVLILNLIVSFAGNCEVPATRVCKDLLRACREADRSGAPGIMASLNQPEEI